ncbi:Ribosome-associated chaperone [Hanseniaspora vineae]
MSFLLPGLTIEALEISNNAKSLLSSTVKSVEPVGQEFIHHAQRAIRNHSFSEYEKILLEKNGGANGDSDNTDPDEALFDDELADASLLKHDPKDWKTADLYAAMGLSKLRYRANDEQIVKAHRKQVLKFHPDKTSAATGGNNLDQDGIFKIIQKAYETLTDVNKRRQYDSCDFVADVEPPAAPSKKTVASGKLPYDFYEVWGPVFASEGRFSKKQPVPVLGNAETPREEIEKFYNFWHRFDSWRTFEFLDEDVPDDSSNRDHKRYIERKNKAARDKKKTADNARLAKLVERGLSEDPRIRAFKDEDKKEKERKKWEKDAGARAEAEAKAKAEAEAKAKAEAEAKSAAESKANAKKAKEAAKSARKKNKRAIRNAPKDHGYFGDNDKEAVIDEQIGYVIDSMDDEQLADTVSKLADASGNAASVKQILVDIAKVLAESDKLVASTAPYFA